VHPTPATDNRKRRCPATAGRPIAERQVRVYDARSFKIFQPEPYSMNAVELLKKLPAAFQPETAGDTDCTVQFNISSPMHIVIKGGTCTTNDGAAGSADVTITMEDDDLVSLMKGELNGMTAFMTGKLQLEGDLMLAQRMFSFFDSSKMN
jgi:putative sterol carrier protein